MPQKKNKYPPALPAAATAQAPVFPLGSTLLAAACLILAGGLAYSNSFRGVFIFDDLHDIVENDSIHQFLAALGVRS